MEEWMRTIFSPATRRAHSARPDLAAATRDANDQVPFTAPALAAQAALAEPDHASSGHAPATMVQSRAGAHFPGWLAHDGPYLAMLVLALAGVIFHLPVIYWIILMPLFAVISISASWHQSISSHQHLRLIAKIALSWSALLLAVFLLYGNGVKNVLNANATSLTMIILLALGTFVAGVQAGAWRICLVGAVLFVLVPSLGWLDQSPLLWMAAIMLIVGLGALSWWLIEKPRRAD
jgi:hypothetical protein